MRDIESGKAWFGRAGAGTDDARSAVCANNRIKDAIVTGIILPLNYKNASAPGQRFGRKS